MAITLSANPKVLIGRTIVYTSMIFFFAMEFWTPLEFALHRKLFVVAAILMLAGLILTFLGKHDEERKQKLEAGPAGEVSFRPH